MSGIFQRASAAAAVLLLAAGCADLRWHKDGADVNALNRDLEDCRQTGRTRAAREAWPPGSSLPRIVGTDVQGRAIVSSVGQADTDRFLAEYDLTHECMSGKGYKLVPAEKPVTK
jgi:hypothetical protein